VHLSRRSWNVPASAVSFGVWRTAWPMAMCSSTSAPIAVLLAGMRASLAAGRVSRLVLETAWEGPAHQQLVAFGFTPERFESVGPLDNISYTNTRQQ
jgi:hypothetical protein